MLSIYLQKPSLHHNPGRLYNGDLAVKDIPYSPLTGFDRKNTFDTRTEWAKMPDIINITGMESDHKGDVARPENPDEIDVKNVLLCHINVDGFASLWCPLEAMKDFDEITTPTARAMHRCGQESLFLVGISRAQRRQRYAVSPRA